MKKLYFSFAIFFLGLNQMQAQVELITLESFQNYFEGNWELIQHYYSIAGITDTYPTDEDSYHFSFSKLEEDSLLLCQSYHNKILIDTREILIEENIDNSTCTWALTDFPDVLEDWPWWDNFYYCPFNTMQDTILMGDLIPDGSSIILVRSDIVLSANEIKEFKELTLYPNPLSTDHIFISGLDVGTSVNVTVYSMTGSLLKKIKDQPVDDGLDLSGMPNGLLLLHIQNGTENHVGRVIRI